MTSTDATGFFIKQLDAIRPHKKIVLTGGAFDLLHIGHIRYLERASTLGDVLVVQIDSDESVCLRKGATRPVITDTIRREMVAALKCVDLAYIDDDVYYYSRILTLIKPDVVVKTKRQEHDGSERRKQIRAINDLLPKATVAYLEEYPGVHTTQLIQRTTGHFREVNTNDPRVTILLPEAMKAQAYGISYSGLQIGAAVLSDNDKVYSGCNISNSSPALALCAERLAIGKSIADGGRGIKAILVYAPTEGLITPCGFCRQSVYDLSKNNGPSTAVYVSNGKNCLVSTIDELLPAAFITPRKKR